MQRILDDAQRAKTGAHADAFAAKMATGGGNMALGVLRQGGPPAGRQVLDRRPTSSSPLT